MINSNAKKRFLKSNSPSRFITTQESKNILGFYHMIKNTYRMSEVKLVHFCYTKVNRTTTKYFLLQQAGKNWGSPEGETKFPYGVNLRGNIFARLLKQSPAALPETLRTEPNKNIFFSLIEKIFRERAKSKNMKKMFLLGLRALRAVAGRSVSPFVQSGFLQSYAEILLAN